MENILNKLNLFNCVGTFVIFITVSELMLYNLPIKSALIYMGVECFCFVRYYLYRL